MAVAMETQIQIDQVLADSAKEIFETMVFAEYEAVDTDTLDSQVESVLGAITFTGDLEGCLTVRCSEECSLYTTQMMLMAEPDEALSPEEINDAIGEITNMVIGSVKTRLQETFKTIDISIPSIIRGQKLHNSLGLDSVTTNTAAKIGGKYDAEFSLHYCQKS